MNTKTPIKQRASKLLAILLTLAVAASLAGCGRQAAGTDSNTPPSSSESVSNSGTTGDSVISEDGKTLTQEYEFYASDDVENAPSDAEIPYNLPEEIEVNGHTYRLEPGDVTYVSEGTRDVVEHILKLEGITQEELDALPTTDNFEVNGKDYKLTAEQKYLTDGIATYEITEEVNYEGQTAKPDVPATKKLSYYSDILGENIEVEGTLKSLDSTEQRWTDFVIETMFAAPEAAVQNYTLYGTDFTVAYNASAPTWTGYQTDILKALGLNASSYKISGAKWTSNFWTNEDGMQVRNGEYYGSRLTSDYVATYTATGEKKGYNATVYYRTDATEDTPKADVSTVYQIKAVAHYVLVK